jgi:hypothetical protein
VTIASTSCLLAMEDVQANLALIIHPDCGLVCGLRVMGLLVVAGWCRVCGVGMLEARLAGRVAGGSTGPGFWLFGGTGGGGVRVGVGGR